MGWSDFNPINVGKSLINKADDAKDAFVDKVVEPVAEKVDDTKDFTVNSFKFTGAITRRAVEKSFDFTKDKAGDLKNTVVDKYNDVKDFIGNIDTTPGADKPPAAQGLEFSETKGASDLAYNAKKGQVYTFPGGKKWEVVDVQENEGFFENGFRAIALKNGDDVIVAFAGTEPKSPGDIGTDLLQGIGFAPPQYKMATDFTNKWVEKVGKDNVTNVGHSLGGALAAYSSIKTGVKATTVNSAPLALTNVGGNPFSKDVRNNPNITNYYVPGEILSVIDSQNKLDLRPGNKIAVEGKSPVYDPLATFKNHSLDSVAPDIGAPTLDK